MVKQLAISFGIGATVAGGFYKTFSKVETAIEEVNKKTAELNQTRSNLDKFKKLQIVKQETLTKILTVNKELKNLKSNLEKVSSKGKELSKTYSSMEKEISNLEIKEKNLKTRLSEISKEMKSNKGNNKSLKEEYKKLKTELLATSNQLQNSKNNFSKLEKGMSENKKETNALNKQYSNLQKKIEDLKNTQRKNNSEFQKTKKILQEQNVSIKDTAKSYKELEKQTERYNKALSKYQKSEAIKKRGESISQKGTSTFKVAGVATGIGAGTLYGAIKAESAFADVKKQFDFETKEIEEKFKADLQKIVTEKKIAISLEDLYGMAANAGQSGLSQEEALDYIEAASKMAVAFGMARDEASKYMFNWKNAFGMDINQLKELTDQINILGNNTGATEGQISEFITRLGNIPKLAGMAENQTAALGASLIEMGMAPEVAATGAKKLLNVLSKGMAASKPEKQALEMLGLDSEYLAVLAKKDSEKAMEIVFKSLSRAKSEQQSAIMTILFGEEGKVAGANILASFEKYQKNLNLVKDKSQYQGATEKEYANRENTTENRLQVLKTKFDILKADFGTELLPFLEEGMKYTSDILGSITKLMKENPEGFKRLIKILVYGTGTLYGLGTGLKVVGAGFKIYSGITKFAGLAIEKDFIGKTIKGFSLLKKVTGNSFASFGKAAIKGIGMLSNPIGLTIIGITALVAAGYYLYKNWDKVKTKAIELKDKVIELVDKYWFMLGPFGQIVKAGRMIYKNWDTIKLKASELKEKIVEMVLHGIENFNSFKEKAKKLLGIPFDYMTQKIEKLKNAGKELKDYFLNIFEEIKNFSITGYIKNKFNLGEEKPIPGFATGGIVSSPTLAMVGEGAYSEAIIPLNNDRNSLNLWEKTGRLIGAYETNNNQSSYNNEFKFTYAPVVTANNAEGVKEILENDGRMKYEEFKSYFERYEREMFRRGRNGR